MFEKVNPSHPDKVADRIAGHIVDAAYKKTASPKIAVEVLIGHNVCTVIIESSVDFSASDKGEFLDFIATISECPNIKTDFVVVPQDEHLAENQNDKVRCGDNGIFKGAPVTAEQKRLSDIARSIYSSIPYDGKYILDGDRLTICQSHASSNDILSEYQTATVNPLGDWTGGVCVDTGATNRKLGSDMADGVTGGGLHGKDLSKADVSVNIYAFLKAQEIGEPVEISCSIGDEMVDGKPYSEIVKIASDYIRSVGGFEKFAEWGLV